MTWNAHGRPCPNSTPGTVGQHSLCLVDKEGNLRRAGARLTAPATARKSVRRERALADLEAHLARVTEALPECERKLNSAQASEDAAQAQMIIAEQALRDARIARSTAEADLVARRRAAETLQSDLRARQEMTGASRSELTDVSVKLEQARAAVQSLSEAVKGAEESAAIAVAEEQMSREDYQASTEDERRLAGELQIASRRVELEQAEHDRQESALQAAVKERDRAIERISALEASRNDAAAALIRSSVAVETAAADLESAQARLDESPDEPHEPSPAEPDPLPTLQTRLESEIQNAQRYRSELEHVNEQLNRVAHECALDLDSDPSSLQPAEMEREPSELDIRRLRIKAEQAEDIDPGVADELQELTQRRDFMHEQMTDLQMASDELEDILREADREARRRFRMTFTQVNSLFGQFFKDIFGGGTGELILDTSDNADGIEIVTQLPGRRVRGLGGLSGGERTLVAGAFLFSLLAASPPPFCILDEVDAALDESNVDRYLGVLRQLSTRTQFAVVTHNRGTMAAANTLYGIVLDPTTGSRALSLRLDEIAIQ